MDNDDQGADETVQDVSDETDQVTPNTWNETNVRFETQKDLFQVYSIKDKFFINFKQVISSLISVGQSATF